MTPRSQTGAVAADSSTTPIAGLVLAYASVAPIACGAAVALLAPVAWQAVCLRLTIIWSGAILCFLAGVRRGDSFHTKGGASLLQFAGIFLVFGLGLLGLAAPWPRIGVAALMAGFVAVGVLDSQAARLRQAPVFFARIRPPQTALAIASLGVLLASTLL